MEQKLLSMLQLQDQLNHQINPNWLEADYAWYRAIWLESAELMEHYGWKWWKSQPHDIEQIRLELIDIWHFGLSAELVYCNGNRQQAATHILQQMQSESVTESDFRFHVDRLALHALEHKYLHIPAFLTLLEAAGSSFDDLYRIYMGKNVLNRFRQDHGYKDGSYVKTWDGREDNEHLADILKRLDAEAEDFQEQIYQALQQAYPQSEALSTDA